MARRYTVSYTGTLTNAGGNADLLELGAADDKPIRLCGWIIAQATEVGDAQEENLDITVLHMTGGTFTSGNGTSVTPAKCDPDDAAAGFTAECNGATVATTTGTTTTLAELAWNERAVPWEHWLPEDEWAYKCRQADNVIVRSNGTVADDLTIKLTFFVKEY